MARSRGTSRVTAPGTSPAPGRATPSERDYPSIRQRKPVLFWTVVAATAAMVLPLIAGLIQALA